MLLRGGKAALSLVPSPLRPRSADPQSYAHLSSAASLSAPPSTAVGDRTAPQIAAYEARSEREAAELYRALDASRSDLPLASPRECTGALSSAHCCPPYSRRAYSQFVSRTPLHSRADVAPICHCRYRSLAGEELQQRCGAARPTS